MPNTNPSTGQDKRRNAFDAFYKANPNKLKGQSLDQAYAAMRREVARRYSMDNKNGSITRVAKGGDAVQKQQQVMNTPVRTPGRSDLHYPVGEKPKVISDGKGNNISKETLQRRLASGMVSSTRPKKAKNFGL